MPAVRESIWVGKDTAPTDGSMSSFAKRLPHTKAVKNAQEMNRRERIRNCGVKIIDHIMKNPDAAVEIWTSIESDLVGERKGADNGDSENPLSIDDHLGETTFGRLAVESQALLVSSIEGGPSQQLLDSFHDKDPHAIPDMCCYLFQAQKSDRLPECSQSASVLAQAMRARLVEVGNRHIAWFNDCVASDGTVDWTKRPLYPFKWKKNGNLEAVRHVSSAEASVPKHVHITQSWALGAPFSDDEARFMLEKSVHYLKDFFPKNSGSNQSRLDRAGNHMSELGKTAAAEIKEKTKDIMQLVANPAEMRLESRQKRLREAALEKARAAIVHKPKRLRSLMTSPEEKATGTS